jgi:hypothetical protein
MAYVLAALKAIPVLWDAFQYVVEAYLRFRRAERSKARDERRAKRAELAKKLEGELTDEERLKTLAALNALSAGRKRP